LKPFRNLAETRTPDGSRFSLHEHDGEYFLKLNGRQLMSTTSTVSEIMLADLPCRQFGLRPVKVLIGGLGLGFSLKRVLELTGPDAKVEVAELLPEVVAWNREFLQGVNGKLLNDKRVKVLTQDVYEVIRLAPKPSYDAILLDVDNGPTSMVQKENKRLYRRRGFDLIARALNPGGQVAFWSAVPEPDFVVALARAGFKTRAVPAKATEKSKRAQHVIYIAEVMEAAAAEAEEKISEEHRAKRKNEALSYFRRRSHR
jgi:spermidine synthase